MNTGWIKLHRQTLDNPIVMKDGDHLAVWAYLMLKATHKSYDVLWYGERKTLLPGQLIASRKSIATELKISESKVERILKKFINEKQIEQQTSNASRCISITKWLTFQESEQQPNSNRTATGHQSDTNKNVKKVKNVKEEAIAPLKIFDGLIQEGAYPELSVNGYRKRYSAWIDYRDEIKAPVTSRAVKIDMNRMVRVLKAGIGEETIVDWMEGAIASGHKGWFYTDRFKQSVQDATRRNEKKEGAGGIAGREVWHPPKPGAPA
tara:strand:- start:11346 stop:12137 length:792 start_codon:yes stop_codon:yes gene_type:complete